MFGKALFMMRFILLVGIGLWVQSTMSAQSAKVKATTTGKLLVYDEQLQTLRVTKGTSSTTSVTLVVAKDLKLTVDEQPTTKKLGDLPEGTYLDMTLNADKTTVVAINAEGPALRRVIQEIDFEKRIIKVRYSAKEELHQFDKDVLVRDERTKKDVSLADVKPGLLVGLRQSLDRTHITEIHIMTRPK